MQELIDGLDSHVAQEGYEIEVRLPEGSWDDIRSLIAPYAEAWSGIGALCNTDALDEDDIDDHNGFVAGRSSLAHEILRRIAAAEHAVQERHS